MPDYSKTKIYQLTNSIDDEIYVGSTIEPLHIRLYKHKYESGRLVTPIYKKMNELGKDNFFIKLIEEYPCNSRTESLAREGYYIKERGTINRQVAGRHKKEYYADNKERIAEWGVKYREEKRETRNEQKRQYYQQNKERINQTNKEYRDNHKEEAKENMNIWVELNRVKIECEHCGEMVSKLYMKKHNKTKKCQLTLKISDIM